MQCHHKNLNNFLIIYCKVLFIAFRNETKNCTGLHSFEGPPNYCFFLTIKSQNTYFGSKLHQCNNKIAEQGSLPMEIVPNF